MQASDNWSMEMVESLILKLARLALADIESLEPRYACVYVCVCVCVCVYKTTARRALADIESLEPRYACVCVCMYICTQQQHALH